jgi:cysteine desulfurase
MQNVYLDNAATTQMDKSVVDYMHEIMINNYGNPSSIYEYGRQSRVLIEKTRTSIANHLNVLPAEIFFTSGGTESINTIISGILQKDDIQYIITSPIEHAAMLKSIEYYSKLFNKEVKMLDVNSYGHIDLEQLDSILAVSKGQALVSLMHANNELGTLLPLKKVSEICRKHNALFLSDTVQTMGKFKNDFSNDILDFAIGSAHKFHGPKGIGFMYINGNHKVTPLIQGGSQERNMRAGTENFAAIAAMGMAFDIAVQNMESQYNKYINLREYLIDLLLDKIPGIIINSDRNSLPNILNIGIPKMPNNEMYLMKLEMNGIYVSGGSACSSGAIKDSHVIKAIGKVGQIRPIRLTMSKFTTKSELDYFVKVLKKI